MKKILRWFVIILVTPGLLLVTGLMAVSFLGISINLDMLRPMVEKSVSKALDRQLVINGPVELVPGIAPRLEVQGLRIDNQCDWGSEDFITARLLRVQLDLLDLFHKKIRVDEVTVEGLTAHMESRAGGVNNWSFGTDIQDQKTAQFHPPAPDQELTEESEAASSLVFTGVDRIFLKEITVHYRDTVLNKDTDFKLDELTGKAAAGEAVAFHGRGSVHGKEYEFDLKTESWDSLRSTDHAWPLSLLGEIAGAPFSATGSLETEGSEKQLNLKIAVGAVDIGGVLSWMGIVHDLKASTEDLALDVQLKGESLHELLEKSALRFDLKGGLLDLSGSEPGSDLLLSELNGNIEVEVGAPLKINLTGNIDATPVAINLEGVPLAEYLRVPDVFPFQVSFTAAGAELGFGGVLDLPLDRGTFDLAMDIRGKRLDSLNDFLHIDLPPWGPYSLAAHFSATKNGYNLSDLAIKVGSSDLRGSMGFDHSGERPEAVVQLASTLLQLDDFELGDWSPEGKKKDVTADTAASDEDKAEMRVPGFLSPASLARLNGKLTVEMKEVMSGEDSVGSGSVNVTLNEGRFGIEPLELVFEKGTAWLEFSFFPHEQETEIHLATKVNRLDVGILAHRMKKDSTMGGLLFLDIELDSVSPTIGKLLAHGTGHFDVGFAPVNLDSGLVDLWAVNLLASLATEVDDAPTSVINCLVASFAMEDGQMQERVFFLDTTHMSVDGEANIDFKNETLKLRLVPSAKRPEFFSLATPVKVRGSFKEFGIGINKLLLTGTVASFVTSPIHVPLRRLFVGERPQDGVEACWAAWDNRNRELESVRGRGD